MHSLRSAGVFVRFAALEAASWLVAVRLDAQTPASTTEPVAPDPGLVTDYWVHVSMVAIVLLFLGMLSVAALRKFSAAMTDQAKGGLWLETHWGGLGGGLGGWRVSNALVYLILVALLGGLTVAILSMAPTYPRVTPDTAQKPSAATEPSTDASKATSGVPGNASKASTPAEAGKAAPAKDATEKK